MLTLTACAIAFFIGLNWKTAHHLARGAWWYFTDRAKLDLALNAVEAAENVQNAKDNALEKARARMAHIYEQVDSISQAKKLALKGVKEIDAANAR